MTFCKYNNSSTRPNFLGSFRNTILKSSTLSLCRGAAILAASRHYTLIRLRCFVGNTISFRYSVTISSRTATDSGDGFGSSPKAYIRSFTSVRKILYGCTIFLEEILFSCVSTGSVMLFCHCRMTRGSDGNRGRIGCI